MLVTSYCYSEFGTERRGSNFMPSWQRLLFAILFAPDGTQTCCCEFSSKILQKSWKSILLCGGLSNLSAHLPPQLPTQRALRSWDGWLDQACRRSRLNPPLLELGEAPSPNSWEAEVWDVGKRKKFFIANAGTNFMCRVSLSKIDRAIRGLSVFDLSFLT